MDIIIIQVGKIIRGRGKFLPDLKMGGEESRPHREVEQRTNPVRTHDRPVITHFSSDDYMGTWWEVGRYDTLLYEKGCDRATAQYSMQIDGTIKIVNTCYKDGQPIRSDTGRGRIPNSCQPGKLAVSFNRPDSLPPSVEWKPFEAPYWIHYTDYYNYAIVGGPDNSFLWILSRRKYIRPSDFTFLLDLVVKIGYDLAPLIFDPTVINKEAEPPVQVAAASPWIIDYSV